MRRPQPESVLSVAVLEEEEVEERLLALAEPIAALLSRCRVLLHLVLV